ncbi:cytochrome P450 [Coprinopsis sp. MPI-PUGE-AT-0042]|nr:cytochrome P450 [Coprinopsis sp. MPI-PUGE-AT-0042]
MDYGPWWRAHRRMFHQYYNKSQMPNVAFLQRLLSRPEDFMEETKYLFGAIIIQISYGLSDLSDIQSLSDAAEVIVQGFSDCAKPGHYLVDTFPILRYVPSWLPGAAWKRRLLEIGRLSQHVLKKTFDDARDRASSSSGQVQDVATDIIEKLPPKEHPDYIAQETIARGTTLTVSSGHSLFIALANYPECQIRAQEEIDATIGNERLPTISDLPNLPYLQAFVKELSRWHSVVPLAVPHIAREDDEYNGYFIPKGTAVLGNTWAIMHDPEIFDEPMEFKPERYLIRDPVTQELKIDSSVLDPEAAAFGYGRRICPGRHLSTEALSLMTASLLATFNVNAPKDSNGNTVKVPMETGNGLIV